MQRAAFTLIDGETFRPLPATLAGERITVEPGVLREALGWEFKPEGLCRGPRCVPVPDRAALATTDGLDVATLAGLLDRPLAVDTAECTAVLGVGAEVRGAELASLAAPDFALPDLAGRIHRLSDHRGRKVLLIAWASW